MKKIFTHSIILAIIFCSMSSIVANEFVVSKKTKTKKETTAQVKEDVVELLESSLRQLGNNIQVSVTVQNKMFDKIKDMCNDNQQSIEQLKELRSKLEKYLKNLEEQQADLQDILWLYK
ncbi:MAG: hypothetical protein JO129_01010 [Candidatus Dependentiae bacterium]|nr:hypothetical protein [Candidatus Dependentiae bacterium]